MEAHPLGKVPPANIDSIRAANAARDAADAALRAAVIAALEAGGSIREVAKAAGLSPSTVQRWSNER